MHRRRGRTVSFAPVLLIAVMCSLCTMWLACGPSQQGACRLNSDCQIENICADGTCTPGCASSDDCDQGRECHGGQCSNPVADSGPIRDVARRDYGALADVSPHRDAAPDTDGRLPDAARHDSTVGNDVRRSDSAQGRDAVAVDQGVHHDATTANDTAVPRDGGAGSDLQAGHDTHAALDSALPRDAGAQDAAGGDRAGNFHGEVEQGVPCNLAFCDVGYTCCYPGNVCENTQPPCSSSILKLGCDGAEDCNSGQQCCGSLLELRTFCSAQGTCTDMVICAVDSDCSDGKVCCGISLFSLYGIEMGNCAASCN